ncbi:MAG: hypothetical protein V8S58_02830 [Lachnospiraceae bacterium]
MRCGEAYARSRICGRGRKVCWQRAAGRYQRRKQQLSLHSLSAVLMDADSGRILYGKDEHQVRPMASTTKIMTCILALELGNPEDFCEISEKAAGQPKVKLGAPAGAVSGLRIFCIP